MEKIELALEELKILQEIIARHDDISFKIKGWCLTLNIGILAALYGVSGGNSIQLSKYLIYPSLLLIIVFFIWLEAIYRVAMNRAIQRTAKIEKEICENDLKDYPKINAALGKPNKIKDQLKALNNVRIVAPYLIIFIIDTLALFIKK